MDRFTEVLIIGSGLAGLFTALNLPSTRKIIIVQKGAAQSSNSMLAQGGIAAELTNDEASLIAHIEDTLKAGSYLNNRAAVELLVRGARIAIDKLIEYGTKFDAAADLSFLKTKEGGHRIPRVVHAGGDATGYFTTNSLLEQLPFHPNITLLENTMALDLLKKPDGKVAGASVLCGDDYYAIYAKCVVIAAGGVGSVYGATTNDLSATGDGIALGYRIGAEIANMEFIQFHPTALYDKKRKNRQRFLLTEALRGEGAYLVNVQKERFMHKYHPALLELAPRDIVSQAIYREMYDTWTDHVFLDSSHLDAAYLEKRFPTVYKRCKEVGYTLGKDLIPVAPCEHFCCGGIITDLFAETTIPNLYTVGESAMTGVHGANRLASNSLLECLVFGMAAAKSIDARLDGEGIEAVSYPANLPVYNYNYKPIRKKIGDYMDEHVGIVRNEKGLALTLEVLITIYDNLLKYPNYTKTYFETLNLATTARLITKAAMHRKESIGCHLIID